ncbi:MAG: hypothetical protein DRP19_02575 [Thermotogae bacterium]|nr:MAG: hypothetical protein DRP19_02575 [Thermotogota bacterium]
MATFSVLTSLFIIIFLQRVTGRLLLSMIAGFAGFCLINFQILGNIPHLLLVTTTDLAFLKLIATVFLIYLTSEIMRKSGDSERFSSSVQKLFRNSKGATAFLPAIIGLMPMPGGAMFTAPMIQDIGKDMTNLEKTTVNYWFRHTLEFFWPVYPAMYLLSSLSGIPIANVSIRLIPLFLVAFASGWLFYNGLSFPKISMLTSKEWKKMIPALVIISTGVLILVFKFEGWFALLLTTSTYASLRIKSILPALKDSLKKVDIFIVLFIVFLYKDALMTLEIGTKLAQELSSLGLNVILVAVILPIVVGMSTVITQTTIGISLPIVLGMGGANLALLTYVFSVAGVLLSPVHLCLVLTSQYFNVNFLRVLQKISLPLAITCSVGWLYLI